MTRAIEQTVLSAAAPIFVPSAPAPLPFFRSDPAKSSVTQMKVKKQGKRGVTRAHQENATAAPDFRSSSIKKPKSPPVRAPNHNNAAPLVRLSTPLPYHTRPSLSLPVPIALHWPISSQVLCAWRVCRRREASSLEIGPRSASSGRPGNRREPSRPRSEHAATSAARHTHHTFNKQ